MSVFLEGLTTSTLQKWIIKRRGRCKSSIKCDIHGLYVFFDKSKHSAFVQICDL